MFKRKKNPKVFGVTIEEAANKSVLKNGIPLVLTRCIDTIEKEALTLEGVYRRTGDLGQVERIIKLYDLGKDPDLVPYDPFVLTSLLKKYFTLLPDPITTYELYTSFIAAKKSKERADKVTGVRELVQKLPDINRFVLYFLMQHLVRVSKHSSENKMSITNLSIVFGPTLFRSTDNSATRLLADAGHLGGCVEIMISNFDRVFDFMLPNLQISVKDDEEIIKLMSSAGGADQQRGRAVTTISTTSSPSNTTNPSSSEDKNNEGVIELRTDRKRLMSTRIGLNFVELSAQFSTQTSPRNENQGVTFDVKKPSEMINIPLPKVLSPQAEEEKKKKPQKSRRYTVSKQQMMNSLEENQDEDHDQGELILLKNIRDKNTSNNLTIDANEEDVNNILSDIINSALLEQTSTPTLVPFVINEPKVEKEDDFGKWKKTLYDTEPSQSSIQYSNQLTQHVESPEEFKETEISEFDIRNTSKRVPSFYEEDFSQIDEETFQKELNSIEVDLDRPLNGLLARINLVKVRLGLLTDNDEDSVPNLTFKELVTERSVLKRELSRFDRLWERERKRSIDRAAKSPLKSLYDRYNRICQVLRSTDSDTDTSLSPIITKYHASAPTLKVDSSSQFISPKSPLYKPTIATTARRTDSFDSAESLMSLMRRKPSSESPPTFVDTSFRNPTFVARKTHYLVSPMSPEENNKSITEKSELVSNKLKYRNSYQLTKSEKNELKKKLHQFQDEFIRQNGRRVSSKNDKKPVEREFEEYKRLKRVLKDKEREVEREVDKLLLSGAISV